MLKILFSRSSPPTSFTGIARLATRLPNKKSSASASDEASSTAGTGQPIVADPGEIARKRRKENFKSILGAVLLFLFLRTFIIEAFRIPSGSMIPALLVNDWLFVNKLAYGPHVPFTNFSLPGYSEPKRFDIAVFKSPYQIDQPENPHPTLVKRIVGVPGDTVHMRGDTLFVNGDPRPQSGDELKNPLGDPDYSDPLFEWQKKHELRGTRFGDPPGRATVSNWGPLLVPSGHYMMLGDNRHYSKDGRYWGLVPRENIRGKPLIVYYSFVPGSESDRAMPALTDIRWWRIGHKIR
jgi:signal peptidase I